MWRVAWVFLLTPAMAGSVSAACYSVYDKSQALIYRGDVSPVDLSRSIGDVVPARFGAGSAMVVSLDARECMPHGVGAPAAPFEGPEWGHVAGYDAGASSSWPATQGGGGVLRGALGYPYVGPRGGHYRFTAGGNRAYAPRR